MTTQFTSQRPANNETNSVLGLTCKHVGLRIPWDNNGCICWLCNAAHMILIKTGLHKIVFVGRMSFRWTSLPFYF
jgi:hypothetical protein